jgi:hypothetical protein
VQILVSGTLIRSEGPIICIQKPPSVGVVHRASKLHAKNGRFHNQCAFSSTWIFGLSLSISIQLFHLLGAEKSFDFDTMNLLF